MAISGAMVSPVFAQHTGQTYNQDVTAPSQQDSLRMAATNLNHQRRELFRKKDAAGAAALYTPDAIYVELLPRLDVMRGRSQIQAHLNDIMAASVSDLIVTVTSAEMAGNGVMLVGGDYSLVVGGGKKINGHFFQTLRQDGGTWKIAMHTFARPEPVTPVEVNQYNSAGGG